MAVLTADQRNVRASVRNFMLCASPAEIRKEIVISLDRGDSFRAACCLEVLLEELPERDGTTLHEFVKLHDVSVVGGEHAVKVFSQDAELENITDFIVIGKNENCTMLMPDPETEIAACPECGFVGCRSGCEAYGKDGV
jgi:predicted HAD superfamily phosphohydrolase